MRHRPGGACAGDERGFTLVEMMMAIFVVGIVLSALAATLIASVKATVANERETRATAYAQQEIEVLQAIDWDVAGLYDGEIASAPARWSDRLDAPDRYDGLELITLPGPVSATSRAENVPRPSSEVTDSGVTYTIDRYLTWIDRTEDGTVDTRRFSIVVTWDDRSTDRAITLTAERAPTQGDTDGTASGARVLQMSLSPNPATLDGDQALTEDVRVRVILNQPSVGTTRLHYHHLLPDNTTWEPRDVAPISDPAFEAGAPANTRFTFIIPAGTRMVERSQDVLFVGRDAENAPIEAFGGLDLIGGTLEGETPRPEPPSSSGPTYPTPPPPEPSEPEEPDDTATPPPDTAVAILTTTNPDAKICVNASTTKTNRPFTITVKTKGLTQTDGVVTVTYQYRRSNGGYDTANDGAVFSSGDASSATYVHTIATGSRRFAVGDRVTFTIDARRQADGDNAAYIVSVPVEACS